MVKADAVIVLEFLDDWKSGREIRNKFSFTNNEWYHLKNWMINGRFVEVMRVEGIGYKNRADYVYKRI